MFDYIGTVKVDQLTSPLGLVCAWVSAQFGGLIVKISSQLPA